MSERSRRDFLKGTLAAGVVAGHPRWAGAATKRSATDWVTLGNSGVKVTRLAFGTGSWGGKVQRELGQEGFTRLVRHAYDRGIRFFETADAYSEMHEMLAIALRGLPRDSYRLMTKYRLREAEDPKATIDRFRKELESEYFDILLLHCVRVPDWADAVRAPARRALRGQGQEGDPRPRGVLPRPPAAAGLPREHGLAGRRPPSRQPRRDPDGHPEADGHGRPGRRERGRRRTSRRSARRAPASSA